MADTGNIEGALEQYRRVRWMMDNDSTVQQYKRQVERAQKRLDEVKAPYKSKLDELEDYITGNVLELEESVSIEGVTAQHRSGHTRVYYKSKIMGRLLARNPMVAEIIADAGARSESEIDPKVLMKVDLTELDDELVQQYRKDLEEEEIPF